MFAGSGRPGDDGLHFGVTKPGHKVPLFIIIVVSSFDSIIPYCWAGSLIGYQMKSEPFAHLSPLNLRHQRDT